MKRGGRNNFPPGWALGAGAGNGSIPAPISANNPFTELNTTLFQNNNNNNRYYYPNTTNSEGESGISMVSLPSTRYSVSSNSNNAWGGPRANHPLNMFMFVPNNEERRILRRMRSRRIARHGARRGYNVNNETSTITEGSRYEEKNKNTNNNGYNANSNQDGGKRRKHRKTLKKRRHH